MIPSSRPFEERATCEPLEEEIRELSRDNPTLHAAYSLYLNGVASWGKAMAMAAVSLAKSNEFLIKRELDRARNATVTYLIPCPEEPRP